MDPISAGIGLAASCWALATALGTIRRWFEKNLNEKKENFKIMQRMLQDLLAMETTMKLLNTFLKQQEGNEDVGNTTNDILVEATTKCSKMVKTLQKRIKNYEGKPGEMKKLQDLRRDLAEAKLSLSAAFGASS
jgi:ferritin-like protein